MHKQTSKCAVANESHSDGHLAFSEAIQKEFKMILVLPKFFRLHIQG